MITKLDNFLDYQRYQPIMVVPNIAILAGNPST